MIRVISPQADPNSQGWIRICSFTAFHQARLSIQGSKHYFFPSSSSEN
jgi:hypothetical protein